MTRPISFLNISSNQALFMTLFIIYYNRIIYLKRITIKLSFYDLTKKVKYNNCVYPTFNLQDLTYMSIEVMVSQTTFILPVPCIEFNCWIIFGSQAIIGVVIQCLQKNLQKLFQDVEKSCINLQKLWPLQCVQISLNVSHMVVTQAKVQRLHLMKSIHDRDRFHSVSMFWIILNNFAKLRNGND